MRRLLGAVLCLTLLLSLYSGEALAQGETNLPDPNIAQTELHYGLKGGLTVSKLRGEFFAPELSDVSFDHKAGFVFGGFFAWRFNEIVALQPEFLWVRKSSYADASLPELDFSQSIKTNLDYLEVPLLIHFSPATEGSIDPIIYAGPSLAFNISAKLKSVTNGQEEIEDIRHQIEGFDLGIVVGAGVIFGEGRLRYSTVRYTVEGRFTTGYSDILVDDEVETSTGDFKNSSFAIMAGIIY
jgi:opacity protein-like surface antigen